jgi:hypothetical protein
MGCNCGKKREAPQVIMSQPTHQFVTIPVVKMVPEPTPTAVEDHFNNIDTIEPIQNGE